MTMDSRAPELTSTLGDIADRAEEEFLNAKSRAPSSGYTKSLFENMPVREIIGKAFGKQIVIFRICLFYFLVILMTLETATLFVIIILASLPSAVLKIGDTTLQILVGATIAQVSTMLIVIIRSVYADSLNTIIMSEKATLGIGKDP
jgi:hypothetical protein